MNTITQAKMAQTSSLVNITGRYKQKINNIDLNAAKKLGLTGVKKYQRCIGQFEIKLDWLYNQILVLAIFVRHLYRIYGNNKVT